MGSNLSVLRVSSHRSPPTQIILQDWVRGKLPHMRAFQGELHNLFRTRGRPSSPERNPRKSSLAAPNLFLAREMTIPQINSLVAALQKLWPRAPAALHREVSTLQRAGGCAPPWLLRSSPAGVRAVRTSAALGLMRPSRRDWGKLPGPWGGAFGAFVIKDQPRVDVRHCSVAAQSISTSNVQEHVEGMPR